jgi:hypothetical protein
MMMRLSLGSLLLCCLYDVEIDGNDAASVHGCDTVG